MQSSKLDTVMDLRPTCARGGRANGNLGIFAAKNVSPSKSQNSMESWSPLLVPQTTSFMHHHSDLVVMGTTESKASEESPKVGRKPLRKRAHPETLAANNNEEETPRKKAHHMSSELLTLRLEGVKTELRDTQGKYEAACREHEAVVEEKDRQIAERDKKIADFEQRLYYAELSSRDQFYGYRAPEFYYSEEKVHRDELPQYEVPRLCSRRGRA